jgi:hypothetical protein
MAFEDVEKLDVNGTRYPLSAAKLQRMSKALSLNGFANFVE